MSNAATTVLTYGILITLASGVIGYGIGLLFSHTVFKGRRRTGGVGLSLAGIAVVLLLVGAAVQDVVFASGQSVAAAFMVLIFVGVVWYGLGSASNEIGDQLAQHKVSPGTPNGGPASQTEIDNQSRYIATPVVATESDVVPSKLDDDQLYGRAWTEFDAGVIDEGTWSRCFVVSDGDENKAKVMYLKERVGVLRDEELKQLEISKVIHDREEAVGTERRIKELKERLARIDLYESLVRSVLTQRADCDGGDDVNRMDRRGRTKLMKAALEGNYGYVVELLAAGANPLLRRGSTGLTAREMVFAEAFTDDKIVTSKILEVAERVLDEVEHVGERDNGTKS